MEQNDCKGGCWLETSKLHGDMSNASRRLLAIPWASGVGKADSGHYLTGVLGFSRNNAQPIHSDIDLCGFGCGFSCRHARTFPFHSAYAMRQLGRSKALRVRCGRRVTRRGRYSVRFSHCGYFVRDFRCRNNFPVSVVQPDPARRFRLSCLCSGRACLCFGNLIIGYVWL